MLCNFIEISLHHGCSPANLLHIFRAPFPKTTSKTSDSDGRIKDFHIKVFMKNASKQVSEEETLFKELFN